MYDSVPVLAQVEQSAGVARDGPVYHQEPGSRCTSVSPRRGSRLGACRGAAHGVHRRRSAGRRLHRSESRAARLTGSDGLGDRRYSVSVADRMANSLGRADGQRRPQPGRLGPPRRRPRDRLRSRPPKPTPKPTPPPDTTAPSMSNLTTDGWPATASGTSMAQVRALPHSASMERHGDRPRRSSDSGHAVLSARWSGKCIDKRHVECRRDLLRQSSIGVQCNRVAEREDRLLGFSVRFSRNESPPLYHSLNTTSTWATASRDDGAIRVHPRGVGILMLRGRCRAAAA